MKTGVVRTCAHNRCEPRTSTGVEYKNDKRTGMIITKTPSIICLWNREKSPEAMNTLKLVNGRVGKLCYE